MNKLLLMLSHFYLGKEQKKQICQYMDFYKICAQGIEKVLTTRLNSGKKIVIHPIMPKVSNQFIYSKKCFARHLSKIYGYKITADQIMDIKSVKAKFTDEEFGSFYAYRTKNQILMAKKNECGIYYQYYEEGKELRNLFHNIF